MDAKLFQEIRRLHGLTQSDMAARLQISRQLVSMIEIDQRKVTPVLEKRIETEFGVDAVERVRSLSIEISELRKGAEVAGVGETLKT